MKALVMGLGQSAKRLDGYDFYIGVNDCPFKVDALVMVDPPRIFSPDRIKTITNNSAPLYTHLPDWGAYRSNVRLISLSPIRSSVDDLFNSTRYSYSICSPFVAVVHAVKMGATEVHLNGVDLIGHKSLGTPEKIAKIQKDFAQLKTEMAKHGIPLRLATRQVGALTNVLEKV